MLTLTTRFVLFIFCTGKDTLTTTLFILDIVLILRKMKNENQ